MKAIFYSLIFTLLYGMMNPAIAKKKKRGFHQVKDFKKNFVKVNQTVYACRFETTNADYRAFLENIRYRTNLAIYQSNLPDTLRWLDKGFSSEEFAYHYFNKPEYDLYPLVNVSYDMAYFYCSWLTQQYMSNPKRPFKRVVFRLPSRSEWQQAAANNNMLNKFPWGSTMDSIPKGMLVNYCQKDFIEKLKVDSITTNNNKRIKWDDSVTVYTECKPYAFRKLLTLPVNHKQSRQTQNGLYHIAGNVSEMVNSRGDCIGGNFKSPLDWLRIDAPNEFYPGFKPCPLIGFRVFMQVLEP